MRKLIHPKKAETIIKLRDGSLYIKKWLYFRNFLPLEVDITSNKKWKNKKLLKLNDLEKIISNKKTI